MTIWWLVFPAVFLRKMRLLCFPFQLFLSNSSNKFKEILLKSTSGCKRTEVCSICGDMLQCNRVSFPDWSCWRPRGSFHCSLTAWATSCVYPQPERNLRGRLENSRIFGLETSGESRSCHFVQVIAFQCLEDSLFSFFPVLFLSLFTVQQGQWYHRQRAYSDL